MTTTINAVASTGLVSSSDGSGVLKVQSNGKTTNALAWVNFDGTQTTPSVRAAYNVSSVTRNGGGDYVVNFASALSDANYSAIPAINRIYGTASGYGMGPLVIERTTTTTRILTLFYNGGYYDQEYVGVAVFGN